jgi:hypothetical protein
MMSPDQHQQNTQYTLDKRGDRLLLQALVPINAEMMQFVISGDAGDD